MIGAEDMEEIIRRLLGDEDLPGSDIAQLILELTSEADLDDDGMLSFAEFEHVVAKSQDFLKLVKIQKHELICDLSSLDSFIILLRSFRILILQD